MLEVMLLVQDCDTTEVLVPLLLCLIPGVESLQGLFPLEFLC